MARRRIFGDLDTRRAKPYLVERGTVVQLREGRNGELGKRKAIVMGNTKPSNYTRAYGREVYVCELFGNTRAETMIATDAIKSGRLDQAKQIIENATSVSEKNITMVKPVGRVKKIPKICLLAMKIEKGKL